MQVQHGLTLRGLTIRPISEYQLMWVRDRLYRIAHPFKSSDTGKELQVRIRPTGWGL